MNEKQKISEKLIVVKWVRNDDVVQGVAMMVVYSTHRRFTAGKTLDFGFFGVAIREGYQILSLPPEQ